MSGNLGFLLPEQSLATSGGYSQMNLSYSQAPNMNTIPSVAKQQIMCGFISDQMDYYHWYCNRKIAVCD
ncbi:hypothetical protein CEXT_149351 [Caerostris extrusa]|uniref:Uncharacterized protein n=1 Tax=Caerostris extrusa TaxID=172846 RepID=A0AAV4NHG1_CAEEX|nr:hypothetical protein CEXT_149351 [Caerostris extrusa]